MGCLGLVSMANAKEEAARGYNINFASASSDSPEHVSVLQDAHGKDGYLMAVLDEEAIDELPRTLVMVGPGKAMPAVVLSKSCSFISSNVYGDTSQYVKVFAINTSYLDDTKVEVSVNLLFGDGESRPSSLACSFPVSIDDANEYGQDVFSIKYMMEKGHLSEELFDFDVDVRQFIIDNSVDA